MKAPIFIVGANRSGTTLLRLLLNAHTHIAIPEELEYLNAYVAGVAIQHWCDPTLTQEQYSEFVQDFLERNADAVKPIRIEELKRAILEDGPPDLRRPYQVALEAWARVHGKKRWGEKTPGNLFYPDILLEMFPDARFIYMVRDPRAGVYSMQRVSFFPDDIVFNALNRHKHHSVGRVLLEQHVPAAQRMTVQYEDLVFSPAETIEAVCDFLGETYEPDMLRFHESAGQFMKTDAVSTFNAVATQPVSTLQTEKWREELTYAEVAIVEHVCASEMKAFGYAFDQHTLRWHDWLHVFIKTQYWKVQCWRHRDIRHYCFRDKMFGRTRRRLEKLWGTISEKSEALAS